MDVGCALMLVEPYEPSLSDVIFRIERELMATYECKHTGAMSGEFAEGRIDALNHALHYLKHLYKAGGAV